MGSVVEAYGQLPLSFESNRSQTDLPAQFLSHGNGYTLLLNPTEAVLSFQQTAASPPGNSGSTESSPAAFLRMQLIGANPVSEGVGLDELPGRSNYFVGNDPQQWRTNIPNYAQVAYHDVYPGIDLVYYGQQRQLEYDFRVAPGADPHAIVLDFQGVDQLELDAQGNLVLHTSAGAVIQQAPVLFQESNGTRTTVPGRYVLQGDHQVRFDVGPYDASRPLVLDPQLVYSTYLGTSGLSGGLGIAVDPAGNIYVTGQTNSPNFPTANPIQPILKSLIDTNVFVAKLDPSGSTLLYSTYLGGNGFDSGKGIAVDAAGNAFVAGFTTSRDFPLAHPLQPVFGGGGSDAFVAKLNATGSALVYATFLGGDHDDEANGIAVDSAGDAYVAGQTDSTTFPVVNALQPLHEGSYVDGFVTKLNAAGSALVYSTYLGGGDVDFASGIAVDGVGNAYVTGATRSTNFPTANPLQPGNGGGLYDVFVTKLNAAGSALVYSTYLGGRGDDEGRSIAVDAAGEAVVTGSTTSTNFPTVNPAQPAYGGGYQDGFVAKLNANGSALVYATYIGGSDWDDAEAIAVDPSGNAYVTGETASEDFPIVDPAQPGLGGGFDAFLLKLNATGAFVYSSYLGGSDFDAGQGIAVDNLGRAYITGTTRSRDFPIVDPLQPAGPTSIGSQAAFIAILDSRVATDPVRFVTAMYRDVLGRLPESAGLIFWVRQFAAGVSRFHVASGIYQSAEHRGHQVDQFYATYLHRPADPGGRTFWINDFQAGATEQAVAQAFLTSQEYLAGHSDSSSFVNGLHADVLGRPADAPGLAVWLRMMQTGVNRAAVVHGFLTSREANLRRVERYYADFLHRSPDPAGQQTWVSLLQTVFGSPPDLVAAAILASDEYLAQVLGRTS
jgi:hypothetical protein